MTYGSEAVTRFWRYVGKGGPDECWPWLRATPAPGYGEFSAEGGRTKAHRASYIINVGPVPAGLVIDHTCRNRACVNPAHLRAVDMRTNAVENSASFAAVNAAQTHCPQGHALTPDNLVQSQPTRKCRTCHNARVQDRKRRIRQGNLFEVAA